MLGTSLSQHRLEAADFLRPCPHEPEPGRRLDGRGTEREAGREPPCLQVWLLGAWADPHSPPQDREAVPPGPRWTTEAEVSQEAQPPVPADPPGSRRRPEDNASWGPSCTRLRTESGVSATIFPSFVHSLVIKTQAEHSLMTPFENQVRLFPRPRGREEGSPGRLR